MRSYLKQESVRIESIGQTLTIQQVSAAGNAEASVLYADGKTPHLAGAVICKYGVVEWANESIEDIANSLSTVQLDEITQAIYKLSSIDAKNSASTLPENSSSN